ncbi:DUF1330 domain-containing protein [Micromonospora sp. NPDC047465]|uniref:DUF1330 domain-containing protein n=1 Tax=Micromonospora sp. NPDC047465 TaxID=3154813 RepID=UPI0033E9D366
MPAFALAHLYAPQINEDVLTYIERIQATLDPFGGRFRVHGAEVEVKEGDWPGTVVIVEFPDLERAPGPGTTRRPTRRSLRCAPGTSRARR